VTAVEMQSDGLDQDLDVTPRADELQGGARFAEQWREAELIAAGNPLDRWHRVPEAERIAYVTRAAVARRRALAQVRALGYDTVADYLVATEALDPSPLPRRKGLALVPVPTIGNRTAADLRYGPPLDPLAPPFLTPEGATVIYGRGGVGKGITAAWLTTRLGAAGHVVMVVDFEGHAREWGSRLRGLGMADADLATVHYRAPFGSDWTAPTGSLAAVAALIREDAERLGASFLIVDSYSVATSNGDTMGGEAAAREYFGGLARIGLPSLTIAHVRGDAGKFPERPFGSVFVHNLARETWAVERLGDDEPDTDPDAPSYGPHVVALEFRNRKANGRAQSPAAFATFSIYDDGTIEVATDTPSGRNLADLAADVLADGPLTLAKIAAAIREDTGQTISEDSIRRTLARHPRRFAQASGLRPHPWSLR
jgi:hypothetical protein